MSESDDHHERPPNGGGNGEGNGEDESVQGALEGAADVGEQRLRRSTTSLLATGAIAGIDVGIAVLARIEDT